MDIDEPHTYTPPKHYYQTSSFDDNEINDDGTAKSPLDRGPYFDISASRNVTALVGNTAYLNCRVRNLGNRTVSWIRHRDLHLLTVGKATYTSDQRYQSVHNPQLDDWSLKVLYPQQRDSGVYECQISTTPPVGYSMTLSVVEPVTSIVGGPDLYIDTGSTVNLTCIVQYLPEPPPLIQWTHNGMDGFSMARGKGKYCFRASPAPAGIRNRLERFRVDTLPKMSSGCPFLSKKKKKVNDVLLATKQTRCDTMRSIVKGFYR
uniref:Ig-like domain-containing protein n=1 Tax=Anopheles melas TaxID=34690 RepID=A0A182TKS6_9DIPT